MSALGQKQTCAAQADVRFVPIADIRVLFDHLVGSDDESRRHCQAERLCGFQVNHQFEFDGGLHRQVSGLLAFKDAINTV
jgi:hypothetical protein